LKEWRAEVIQGEVSKKFRRGLSKGIPSQTSILNDVQGQSTIEFALTMMLFLSFTLFYFQISMVFAFGSYVHYATFMSARAYLAGGPEDQSEQASRARDVIVAMLKKSTGQSGVDKFPFIAKGSGGGDPVGFEVNPPSQFNFDDPAYSWMQGVRYTFTSRLFMIPMVGSSGSNNSSTSNNKTSVNAVTLTSESWLGREPGYADCQNFMGAGNGGSGWIFDNGC
jgi:hypothetical protein